MAQGVPPRRSKQSDDQGRHGRGERPGRPYPDAFDDQADDDPPPWAGLGIYPTGPGGRERRPRPAEADDARADNGHPRRSADRCDDFCRSVQRGSLRWNDPDRFDGFDLSRAFGAAPLADVVIMGGLRSFGKGEARPAMPQVARADKPDYEDDDGANQRRLGDAEMFEGVTIINRPDGLAEIERRRMQRQSGATRSLREIGREPECNCAACRSRCRTGEIRRFRCTRAC